MLGYWLIAARILFFLGTQSRTMAFLSPAFYPEFEFEDNFYLTAQPLITNERVFYANISTLWVSEVIAHIK